MAQQKDGPAEITKCGIIMPIASMPEYDANHWTDVRELIQRSIEKATMEPLAVWTGSDFDIIQARIVQNLYDLPLAICVTSGLNPNVMLELGMRLAFGKATIIVQDGLQRPPFDINAIEYLSYPRDLHILKTEKFVEDLAERLVDIHSRVKSKTYKPFINTFGTKIEPGQLSGDAVSLSDEVLRQIDGVRKSVQRLEIEIIERKSLPLQKVISNRNSQIFMTSKPENYNSMMSRVGKVLGVTTWYPHPSKPFTIVIESMSGLQAQVASNLVSLAQEVGATVDLDPS